jgi:hypothetical protein
VPDIPSLGSWLLLLMVEQTHLHHQHALAAYVHGVNKHILDRQQAAHAATPPP